MYVQHVDLDSFKTCRIQELLPRLAQYHIRPFNLCKVFPSQPILSPSCCPFPARICRHMFFTAIHAQSEIFRESVCFLQVLSVGLYPESRAGLLFPLVPGMTGRTQQRRQANCGNQRSTPNVVCSRHSARMALAADI